MELADRILSAWRLYTDEEAGIFAETNGEPHNTITPIARKRGDFFELDLVLRNNRTTPERPDGLFHPRRELHHIKKENIGLIEVMGLAILPGRLKAEMAALAEEILTAGAPGSNESTAKHKAWGEAVMKKHPALCRDTIDGILREELGLVFLQVLEDAAVFPCRPEGREAFLRFIRVLSAR